MVGRCLLILEGIGMRLKNILIVVKDIERIIYGSTIVLTRKGFVSLFVY